MGIHRRTLLQALLALPVVSLANRAEAMVSLARPMATNLPAPIPFEANLRWAMDAELTPCRHYSAQDAMPAFKARRHTKPCVLHVGG